MFHIPTILLALFSLVISQNTVCIISIPIGLWLENVSDTLRCHTVEGHFILDETANHRAKKLFAVFSNLTKIEGCIYVKGYTGSRNLSFFSKLEDVHCNEKEAIRYNLTNVIYVLAPKLKTMGFHSLKSVVGPGEIYLSYEKEQMDNMGIPDGEQCFSKEEIIFFSYHSQFRRKMYPNCDTTDLCFRLDTQKKEYFLVDIPDNCTVFAGLLCLTGPYEQDDAVFQKFQNLTLLIGQIQVMGTLLNRLDTIFPKLQMVYPYVLPNLINSFIPTDLFTFRCMSTPLDYEPSGNIQYVHVGLNRFLSDMSLPSLEPIRPVDVSLPMLEFLMPPGFKRSMYIPDTIQDHCSYFPQFNDSNCGAYRGEEKYPDPPVDAYSFYISDYLLMVHMLLGMILSIRCIILLSSSNAAKCLPYSRYLIILVITVTTLLAVKNCLLYQRAFDLLRQLGYTDLISSQFLSEFSSIHLTQPFLLEFVRVLAATKHVCLVVIISCYLDTVIYYRIRSTRISTIFCCSIAVASALLCLYLTSHLHLAVRGRRPNYSREPRHIVFMPFVMAAEFRVIFEENVPATQFLKYDDDQLDVFRWNQYGIEDVPLDDMGSIFPDFCNYSDAIMAVTVVLFHLLRRIKFSYSHYHFTVLMLLYIQLSMNRIRYYLYTTILINDYCTRLIDESIQIYTDPNCYTPYDVGVPGTVFSDYLEAYMDEWTWNLLKWVIGKLPYLCYPIVSFYCWRFARFHYYLGAVIRLKMRKESHNKQITANRASEFDLTPPRNVGNTI